MVFEHIFVGDFENTTGGNVTYVYGGGFMETTDTDVTVFENIDDSMKYILSLPKRSVLYFHNGSNYDAHLIVYWLLQHGYVETDDRNVRKRFSGICADGKWYVLKIRTRNYNIEIRDTCLLINGSLSAVGKALGCPTSKLKGTIDYDAPRGIGYVMTDVEREYLKHDVLLLKEIVIAMQSMGGLSNYVTAGAFAFAEMKASLYKTLHHKSDDEMELLKQHPKFKEYANKCFRSIFPEIPIWQDDEIRHAYRGGWCYNNTNGDIIYDHGLVLDVNSLYPSVLLSNHTYPYGMPRRYVANRVPASGNDWLDNEIAQYGVTVDNTHVVKCYIVEISTRFRIKDKHVPCIQLKGNSYFVPTEYATTSEHIVDGKMVDDDVVISLCSADLELFFEQYNILSFAVLSGYEFSTYDNFFDDFITTHYEAKKKAAQTGNRILKNTSKIILNSSYGGFAQRIHKRRNVAYIDDDGSLAYNEVKDETYPDRTYTAVGVFCTAYARQITVRTAQMFYDDFCYSDTDSVHLVLDGLTYDDVKDKINIDPVELGYWKLESEWDMARFVRPKTYMERTVVADGVALDEPKIDIKACGLTDEGKDMLREDDDIWFKFTFGLALEDCKLMKHHCVGGVNLVRRDWCIRG